MCLLVWYVQSFLPFVSLLSFCLLSLKKMVLSSSLRSLDTEIRSHCKACTENFDYRRLSFVLEGKGVWQDQQLEAAQTKANSALRRSQASAFELFKTNLEQDQMLRRRYISATSGDESRARSAIIESLEDIGLKTNQTLQ